VADLTFYLIVAAIVGSRLLYMIVEYERFLAHPLDAFKIWEGGLVFYGGLLACIAVSWWYTHLVGWKLRGTADLFMPGVALGHSIGRLGCLMAGCCYGKPVSGDPWWAITFPHQQTTLAPGGIPLIPTQPIESLVEISIFLILIIVRRHKKFEGQVFLTYLIIYAIVRSVLEIFRGDTVRGFVIPDILSTSQLISLLVVLASIVYYRHLKSKHFDS
jgi:phosphatidylglycerol:prolipoprotein diacylglycerol transferase